MSKQEAEWSNRLSIFWLKKQGYLNKEHRRLTGRIVWSYLDEERSSIGFTMEREDWGTPFEDTTLTLNYTHTSSWTGEKSNMNNKIQLTTTSCNFGGQRYWFICPLSKNGRYCGKRVGVMYLIGKWYGCRHCGEIAYASQMRGGKYRGSSVTFTDIDKLDHEIKKTHYRGRPTKKYLRFLRLNAKIERDFMLLGTLGMKRK